MIWAPDGIPLHPEAQELAAQGVGGDVHLRLKGTAGIRRAACGPQSAGQWWSGDTSEVTCAKCRAWQPEADRG